MRKESCPYCKESSNVKSLACFVLPERKVFNRRAAKLTRCEACTQIFMSIQEQSKPHKQQDEIWNLYHYYLPEDLQRDFFINATMCYNRNNKHCRCALHMMISQMDFSELERLDG